MAGFVLTQMQGVYAACFFAVVLGAYTQTMFPGVGGGDSGELVATACAQAPSHPPGYPLLLLLNGAWLKLAAVLLPTKSRAFHANLLNAILGAAAAATVLLLSVTLAATQSAKEASKVTPEGESGIEASVFDLQERPLSPNTRSMKGKKKKVRRCPTKAPNRMTPTPPLGAAKTPPSPSPLAPLQDHEFFACIAFSGLFAFSKGIWEYCTQVRERARREAKS